MIMKNILGEDNILRPPHLGEIVEGEVIGKESSGILVDLSPFGTGIIYNRELQKANLNNLKAGDKIFAKISELESEDGHFELSLREAREELAWKDLREKKEKSETLQIKISKANKGGLIAEAAGVSGFLPVSQLSTNHYPQVEGGDTSKILRELQKLVGQELKVQILDLDPKQKKLIFSEKASEKAVEKTLKKASEKVKEKPTAVAALDEKSSAPPDEINSN